MRSSLAVVVLAMLGLTVGLPGGSAGAAAGGQTAMNAEPHFAGPHFSGPHFSGERDKDVGPRTAHVDPAHASPGTARAAALSTPTQSTDPGAATADTTLDPVPADRLDPAVYGQWRTLSYRLPLRAIHATLLRTGKFLLIAGSGNNAGQNVIRDFKAYLWNPATGGLTSVPVPYDAFCSGHLVDANGDVVVFGGTAKYRDADGPWIGSRKVYKFVVAKNAWTALPRMKQGRWYPTNLMDGKRRMFAFSGKDATGATPPTHEMYRPGTRTWSSIASSKLPLYPGMHLLRGGGIAYTGAHFGGTYATAAPRAFDPITGARRLVTDPKAVMDLAHRNSAMSALVGSARRQLAWVAGGGFPAVRSTYFIDFNTSTPAAVAGPRLPAAKAYVSISHLPDLTALETGGGTGTDAPVFEASILDPGTRRLQPVAPPAVPRTYHSSSITLPNGRVVTFGGDPSGDDGFELRIEIFSPPYLFQGTRPTIESAPVSVRYGSTYTVSASASSATLSSAVIMRPGSATHAVDANQRVLKLSAKAVAGGLRVTLPANVNLAPPGWYLLFVNDSRGRPSVGRWIRLS